MRPLDRHRSASSARTCATFAATSAAAELSAVPNGETMIAGTRVAGPQRSPLGTRTWSQKPPFSS